MEIKDIVIVLVLYKPNTKQLDNLKMLSSSADVIAVDNTPLPQNNTVEDIGLVEYVSIGKNVGIACAQNIGIDRAIQSGYNYILFLDQDSVVDKKFLRDIMLEYQHIKSIDSRIAALGPRIVNIKDGKPYKDSIGDKDFAIVDTIISSGTLVETKNLQRVGGMEEDLFIDVVDHEWCWRCKSNGYNVYMTRRVHMHHEVGNNTVHFLGLQLLLSSPFRYYYKYRNSIWMMKRDYVPFIWKIKKIIWLLLYMLTFTWWSIIDSSKKDFLQYSIKGIKAGLFPNK